MKKLFKKVVAVVLSTVLFLAAVPLQSFAALDSLKMPEIAAVEIVGEDTQKALSFKEIENFYKELKKEFENFEYLYGLDVDDATDFDELISKYPHLKNLLSYNISYSGVVNYDYEVTLSNGDKVTVKAEDSYVEYKKIFEVSVKAYVTYEDYLQVKESKAKKVNVTVEGEITNLLLESYVEPNTASFTEQMPVVECYVKSISPVSGVSDKFYEFCDYYEIGGAKFKVVYPDGTTKVLEVEKHVDFNDDPYAEYVSYTLDGEELYIYEYDEGVLEFSYVDAVVQKKISYYEDWDPFKSVEITDYVFDQNVGLSSISYRITMDDSSVKTFTKNFTNESEMVALPYGMLDVVDGFYVFLTPYPDSSQQDKSGYIYFNVTAGICEDSVEVEFSSTQEINILVKIIEKIAEIIDIIKNVIGKLFNVVSK